MRIQKSFQTLNWVERTRAQTFKTKRREENVQMLRRKEKFFIVFCFCLIVLMRRQADDSRSIGMKRWNRTKKNKYNKIKPFEKCLKFIVTVYAFPKCWNGSSVFFFIIKISNFISGLKFSVLFILFRFSQIIIHSGHDANEPAFWFGMTDWVCARVHAFAPPTKCANH